MIKRNRNQIWQITARASEHRTTKEDTNIFVLKIGLGYTAKLTRKQHRYRSGVRWNPSLTVSSVS